MTANLFSASRAIRQTVIATLVTLCALLGLIDGFAQSARYRRSKSVLLHDLDVTTGATRSDTASEVCSTATGTVRHVTSAMKRQVCASYGIAAARCNGRNFEIDHLIPLELGGSNGMSNLWPQPYRPQPGAREKDVLENYLHRQVCSGRMEIRVAQQVIVQDWFSAWKQMVTSPH